MTKISISLVFLLFNTIFINTYACTERKSTPFHFVLVHGYRSGGWCFYKLGALIQKSGHKFSTVDLKSAGVDPTDPKSLHSFEEYNRPLLDLLAALPENEKVILVGHSAGGLSVTHATHLFPEKIQLVIYVAATMLRLGFQTDQDRLIGIPKQIRKVYEDKLQQHRVISKEDMILGKLLRKGEGPIKAITNANFNESEGIDKVKRVYIKTEYDQTLKPWQQNAMLRQWKPSGVLRIRSEHNPQFAAPKQLFRLIVKAARRNRK